jgi:hypothetical protein
MSDLEKISGFGASDITDNRKLLEWKSRYPAEASREITIEAIYLGSLLLLIPWLLLAFLCHAPEFIWKYMDPHHQEAVSSYGMAWVGGMLGGTLFTIKWLYHVVAKELWNLDRRLWRFFTPHISGGLAFAVIVLISSGFMRIFDSKAANSHSVVVGLAFLVGYFSDNAVAKLSEIANTLFGTSTSRGVRFPKRSAELAQHEESTETQSLEVEPPSEGHEG